MLATLIKYNLDSLFLFVLKKRNALVLAGERVTAKNNKA